MLQNAFFVPEMKNLAVKGYPIVFKTKMKPLELFKIGYSKLGVLNVNEVLESIDKSCIDSEIVNKMINEKLRHVIFIIIIIILTCEDQAKWWDEYGGTI